jgi:hypothetical protein
MFKIVFYLVITYFVLTTVAVSQQSILSGFVFSEKDGKALPGVTIRVPGTNIGTYSSSRGFFRLKIPAETDRIKISSIGYKSKIVKLNKNDDTIFVYLNEIPVKKEGVTVTGAIEADEVIKRAVARKRDNVKMLKTFKGRLYTKLFIELGGSMFIEQRNGNTFALGSDINDEKQEMEKFRNFIMETFSDVYIDFEKGLNHTNIIQRRQTANLEPANNLMALSKFISFYNDEVKVGDVQVKTPLSEDAFSYYAFEIIDRQVFDDKYVYVISVIPTTEVYPAFVGTIKILEGTYNLIEVNLRPSENTAITFIDSLEIRQKYTQSIEKIWYPSYLEATGKARFEFIKGFISLLTDFRMTGIYSDVVINQPLPDSLYQQEKKRKLTVEQNADSTKPEFWENNALREVTQEEKEIYVKIDTLVAKDSVRKKEIESTFQWSLWPYIDFNRVSSASVGLQPSFEMYNVSLSGMAAYSFGMKRVIWQSELAYNFDFGDFNTLQIGVEAFSIPENISLDKSFARLINTGFAGLFHFDYYDYMRKDGLSLFADYRSALFDLRGTIEISEQSSLPKTTNNSIFSKKQWRENPKINDGEYTFFYLNGRVGNVNYFIVTSNFENELEFASALGKEKNLDNPFVAAYAKYKTSIPLFYTGYTPVKLFLSLEGGITTSDIPMQYMNKMQSSMLFLTKFGNFLTAPPAEYGGRQYYAGHFALNLGDLWWRALRLPLYEGRG